MINKKIFALCFFFIACSSVPSNDGASDLMNFRNRFEKLQPSSPSVQVVSLLGTPTKTEHETIRGQAYTVLEYEIGQTGASNLFDVFEDGHGTIAALGYRPSFEGNSDHNTTSFIKRSGFNELSQMIDPCSPDNINTAYYYNKSLGLIITYELSHDALDYVYRANPVLFAAEFSDITTCPLGKSSSADPIVK